MKLHDHHVDFTEDKISVQKSKLMTIRNFIVIVSKKR